LDAFYMGDGRVAAAGLRVVAATRIAGGGELVTAVTRGGRWRLRVVPR